MHQLCSVITSATQHNISPRKLQHTTDTERPSNNRICGSVLPTAVMRKVLPQEIRKLQASPRRNVPPKTLRRVWRGRLIAHRTLEPYYTGGVVEVMNGTPVRSVTDILTCLAVWAQALPIDFHSAFNIDAV